MAAAAERDWRRRKKDNEMEKLKRKEQQLEKWQKMERNEEARKK